MSNLYRTQYTPTFHVLDLQRFPASVERLDPALTINGATVYPELRYKGGDATANGWNPWGYGEKLILQSGTAPTYNNGSPFLGSFDDSVYFNGGGIYQAASAGLGNVTTEDFVVEAIYQIINQSKALYGTYNSAGASKGWFLYGNAASTYQRFFLGGATGSAELGSFPKPSYGWIHTICFIDGSGSGARYINGVYDTTIDVSGVGSLTSSDPFYIGGYTGLLWSGPIAYLAMWKRSSWLDTHLQATVATQRFASLTGSRPIYSYSGVTYMTASGATVNNYGSHLKKFENLTGNNKSYNTLCYWPRSNGIIDANGKAFIGTLSESSVLNFIIQSDAMGTTWTQVACTSITNNGAVASDGLSTMDGVVGTAVDTQHGVSQAVTLTATNWVLSAEVRAGSGGDISYRKDWIYLQDATVANAYAYFQISTASYGTVGAGIGDKGVINCGGGLIRPWIRFLGTAASHTINLYAAHADNDNDFAGDASTNNIWLGAVQIEVGNYPSSKILTTTASTLRTADNSYYTLSTGDISTTEGALYFEFHAPVFTPGRSHYLCSLSAAGSATNAITAWLDTNGRVNAATASTGGSSRAGSVLEGSGSRCDNVVHTCLVTWRYDELKLYVDNVLIGTDATVDIPVGLTRLSIGTDCAAANNAGPVLVSNVKVFPKATLRMLVI